MADASIGFWTVPLAVLGGAIRVSTPFLFVSLGECITERSGRINLGLEGTLVMGAMSAYGISYLSGSPWLGVLAAACAGSLLGALPVGSNSAPTVQRIETSSPAGRTLPASGAARWMRTVSFCPSRVTNVV